MKLLLNELFEYRDGALYHKKARPKVRVGERAGSPNSSGYRNIRVQGRMMKEHRVIWIMHHGDIPDGYEVDHKDRNRGNSRIGNLRLAKRGENRSNAKINHNSTSGVKGVYWNKTKGYWVARVWKDKRCYARYYQTKEQAADAVASMRINIHGEFANHGVQV